MGSLSKVIGVVCCGLLLSLGPFTVAQAEMSDRLQGGQRPGEALLIQGEVLRVDGNDCVIKGQDGNEVRLQIDLLTLKVAHIEPGDHIEAQVNDQNHVLSFRPVITDRRNDQE